MKERQACGGHGEAAVVVLGFIAQVLFYHLPHIVALVCPVALDPLFHHDQGLHLGLVDCGETKDGRQVVPEHEGSTDDLPCAGDPLDLGSLVGGPIGGHEGVEGGDEVGGDHLGGAECGEFVEAVLHVK